MTWLLRRADLMRAAGEEDVAFYLECAISVALIQL